MTYRFKIGDHVRVSRVYGSSWQDRHGTVVDVILAENGHLQECAVDLDGDRRWFMEQHLIRAVSPKFIRFFRHEALDRWGLDADHAALLDGDCDQLLQLLCEHCGLAIRRAQAEVEAFYDELDQKIEPASNVGMPRPTKNERPIVLQANSGNHSAKSQSAA